MPGPTLTAAEIAQVKKEAAKQSGFAESLAAAIPAKMARAAELGVVDGAFKKFFDYYNDSIIGKYDAERKALNGTYIALPITEADVVGPANIDGSVRTTPSLPATDIIRVTQFDGGGTSTTTVNETQGITDQIPPETRLVSGYTTFPTLTAVTAVDALLTSVSTTLKVVDSMNATAFTIGDTIVISDGVKGCVVQVTSVTQDQMTPTYKWTLGIVFVVPLVGTIVPSTVIKDFLGFTNSERTAKVATDPGLQNVMDAMIADLTAAINVRIARLNEQLTAISTNQDPDAVAQLATAATNVNTSKTFLTNYLVTTIISNAGLATLSTERGVRSPQIAARVAQIVANYTGQTENYFNRRYSVANDRANTSRGTLRLQLATTASVSTLVDYAAGAQQAADALNAILP
jgi:hypothetical protein